MRMYRSLLWESSVRIAEKLRGCLSESRLGKRLIHVYPAMEHRLRFACVDLPLAKSVHRLQGSSEFLLLFLFVLPFLNLLPHPTVVLCVMTVFFQMLCAPMWIAYIRTLRLIDLSVLLLMLAALLSCIGAAGGRSAVSAGITVALCISLYFPTALICRSRMWKRRAAWTACISGGVCGLCGVLQYYLTELELKWVDASRFSDIGGRVTVFFGNPNVLAIFLLLCAPLTLFCILDVQTHWRGRGAACVSLAAMLLCLVLTWSRGAWLGILFSIFVFFLLYGKRSNAFLFWMLFPALCAIPYLPHNVRNRFASIGSIAESSIRYRLYTWKGVLRMLKAHPLGIGAGRDSFSKIYPRYAVSGTERVLHAHNLLLRLFCEWGIGGILLFILFAVFIVFYTLSHMQDQDRALTLACFSSLCAVGVMSLFDDIWYHYGLCALFWIVCGILCAQNGACHDKA